MTNEALATASLPWRHDLLSGQVALVSGAGSGIGRACAYVLGRLGAKVALCGRRLERLQTTADGLEQLGIETLCHAMSIRDPDAVARLHDAVTERFGHLDILVNNAGGQFPQAAIDFSTKGWNAVVDTNLNGAWSMMQTAARRWRDTGRAGTIVNIVAVVGRGMPGIAHSCAARAGVIHASKTVAVEWAPLKIRVNCIAPGVIASEGMDVYSEEARRDYPNSNPMKRFGAPLDVANAVVYLAGPTGDFITGEVLTVDGGGQMWGDLWTIPATGIFHDLTRAYSVGAWHEGCTT